MREHLVNASDSTLVYIARAFSFSSQTKLMRIQAGDRYGTRLYRQGLLDRDNVTQTLRVLA